MQWRIQVGTVSPSAFAAAVDQAVISARIDPGDTAATHAVTVGATALKRLATSWPVAVGAKLIGASISGATADGGGNDRLTIDLWRAD